MVIEKRIKNLKNSITDLFDENSYEYNRCANYNFFLDDKITITTNSNLFFLNLKLEQLDPHPKVKIPYHKPEIYMGSFEFHEDAYFKKNIGNQKLGIMHQGQNFSSNYQNLQTILANILNVIEEFDNNKNSISIRLNESVYSNMVPLFQKAYIINMHYGMISTKKIDIPPVYRSHSQISIPVRASLEAIRKYTKPNINFKF